MRIVKTIPPRDLPRTKSSLYDRFFDGRVWQIEPGDFPHTNLATLRATLIRRAQRQGWTIITALRREPERLFIHCINKEKKEA